jgi:hypothetical protein
MASPGASGRNLLGKLPLDLVRRERVQNTLPQSINNHPGVPTTIRPHPTPVAIAGRKLMLRTARWKSLTGSRGNPAGGGVITCPALRAVTAFAQFALWTSGSQFAQAASFVTCDIPQAVWILR